MPMTLGYLGDDESERLLYNYLQSRCSKAKILSFKNYQDLLNHCLEIDVCVVTVHLTQTQAQELSRRQPRLHIVYVGENLLDTMDTKTCCHLKHPMEEQYFFAALDKTRRYVRSTSIIVDTADGYVKVPLEQILYITAIDRCIEYHLTTGISYRTKTMRAAFKKEINTDILLNSDFIFLKPNLVLNLSFIQRVSPKGEVEFCNGDIIYLSKPAYNTLINVWK